MGPLWQILGSHPCHQPFALRASPDECVRAYTNVACSGSLIDAAAGFILICAYTGKEVV